MLPRIFLIRHGETEWSLSGKHTSCTDIPLTVRGEQQARHLAELLGAKKFARVFTSPLKRARQTCELAGFGAVMTVQPNLVEWNYGDYEGLTSPEIHALRPDWNLFQHGAPGGESPDQVSQRADSIVSELRGLEGSVVVFSHGHFLRALAVRWVRLPISQGQRLLLGTASLSILAFEHGSADEPVIALWNARLEELAASHTRRLA